MPGGDPHRRGHQRLGRQVDTEDLIDAHEVAAILGLEQSNSVTTYLRRYPDMPRPVIEKGGGRVRLWVRRDMERWNNERPRRPRASR
jgi:predicted DNA-binding transcriptional regulator AlpA